MRRALDLSELTDIYGRIARRYDRRHSLLTAHADQRGRALLVKHAVREGDRVLDCGAGTGTTGLMAAHKVGPAGKVTLFDLSEAMLQVARGKVARDHLDDRVTFRTGDLVHLPFPDAAFDVVLSTYSLCPVYDPAAGALEMYRVTRPGGKLGIAHSAEPPGRLSRALADAVESLAWRFRGLSMGCRAVDVLPALLEAGAKPTLHRRIGVPLWPFVVLIVEKPLTSA